MAEAFDFGFPSYEKPRYWKIRDFSLIVPPFTEYPSLELQPWMYGLPQTTFYR